MDDQELYEWEPDLPRLLMSQVELAEIQLDALWAGLKKVGSEMGRVTNGMHSARGAWVLACEHLWQLRKLVGQLPVRASDGTTVLVEDEDVPRETVRLAMAPSGSWPRARPSGLGGEEGAEPNREAPSDFGGKSEPVATARSSQTIARRPTSEEERRTEARAEERRLAKLRGASRRKAPRRRVRK